MEKFALKGVSGDANNVLQHLTLDVVTLSALHPASTYILSPDPESLFCSCVADTRYGRWDVAVQEDVQLTPGLRGLG